MNDKVDIEQLKAQAKATSHDTVQGNFLKMRGDNAEEAEKDIDQMIENSGCSEVYFKLEECIGENDRDWRKCQNEVKLLKQCSDAQKKKH